MKVEIEQGVFDVDIVAQIMIMVDLAQKAETFDKFINDAESSKYNLDLIRFGAAGSHAWVSDYKGSRILLITKD